MKKMLKNRKGFTLTELCIVIAIAAIVGVMITTTVVLTATQKEDIQSEAAFIKEVTDIQIKTSDWLRNYDNTRYVIELETDSSTGKTSLSSYPMGENSETPAGTLIFSGNALVADGVEIGTYKNVTDIVYHFFKGTEDELQASVIVLKVEAHKGAGEKTRIIDERTLMFPLFSAITRERIVDGKGQW